jgi:MoxR-like ATPase
MSPEELTSKEAVRQALMEFDELGRDRFLEKYGFGPAHRYFLRDREKLYDSKAIFGVAYGYQHPEQGPLSSKSFTGGEATVKKKLEDLGFEIVGSAPDSNDLMLPQNEVNDFARTLRTIEYEQEERNYKLAVHYVLRELLARDQIESPTFPELLAAFFEDQLDPTLLNLSEEQQAFVTEAVAPVHGLRYAFANLCGGRFGVNNFVWIPGAVRDGLGKEVRRAFAQLMDVGERLPTRVDAFRAAMVAVQEEAKEYPSWQEKWQVLRPSLAFIAALLGGFDPNKFSFYPETKIRPSFETLVGTWPKGSRGEVYEQVVQFVQDVRGALERQGAPVRDLIDAQSFLWLRGSVADPKSWIFQANPSLYDIDRALRELPAIEWTVRQHRQSVHSGDRAFIWRSGSDAGIVAVGSVLGEPEERAPDGSEYPYYLKREAFADVEPRVKIGIEHVLDPPLLRSAIAEDPHLAQLAILRMPRATVHQVKQHEADRLTEYVGHPSSSRYFILQQRTDRAYEWDEEERVYHFTPKASGSWKQLSQSAGARFVYYRPGSGGGQTAKSYFGHGRIANVAEEQESGDRHFRAQLEDYQPFARPVPSSEYDPRANVQMSIAEISREQFEELLRRGSLKETVPFTVDAIMRAATREPRALLLDEATYASAFAALESGKHIVFTGPPGTAKTTLAEAVAEAATEAGLCAGHVLTTATADWTTYETIGGLKPTRDGQLAFASGHFLEAIERNHWLVIDELNRSNFDRAFGQLFTVLSGQAVQLPYEREGHHGRLVLAPQGASVADGSDIIRIPKAWRVIATMNVFDKSLLFEMSFALMRRFAFIEVPAPRDQDFESLILRSAGSDTAAAELAMRFYPLRQFKDLGPALYMDMTRFLAVRRAQDPSDDEQLAFEAFYSYLLPQFEGIDQATGEQLWAALKPLVGAPNMERLRKTLNAVLGLEISASHSRQSEEEEPVIAPDEAQIVQE